MRALESCSLLIVATALALLAAGCGAGARSPDGASAPCRRGGALLVHAVGDRVFALTGEASAAPSGEAERLSPQRGVTVLVHPRRVLSEPRPMTLLGPATGRCMTAAVRSVWLEEEEADGSRHVLGSALELEPCSPVITDPSYLWIAVDGAHPEAIWRDPQPTAGGDPSTFALPGGGALTMTAPAGGPCSANGDASVRIRGQRFEGLAFRGSIEAAGDQWALLHDSVSRYAFVRVEERSACIAASGPLPITSVVDCL